jgi:Fic family protein
MLESLDRFEKYLHAADSLPSLIRLAAVHYQFEAIHPFLDGNGRIGRLLITLLLCNEGILPQPLLYLSAYFNRHRGQYYERLRRVSQCGEWEQWVLYFLLGVVEQGTDALERANRLLSLHQDLHGRCQAARQPALLLKAIDELFTNPAVTIRHMAEVLAVTWNSAAAIVRRLEEAGILTEVSGRSRNRVYVARPIVDIVEEQPEA